VREGDLLGLRIRNTENVQHNIVRIGFRRLDQLITYAVWDVLEKVVQSNARFVLSDSLEVHLDQFRIPAGNCNRAEKTKEKS